MGYTSKNLSGSRRKAVSASADTQSKLHQAISSVNESSRGIKDLTKKIAQDKISNRELRYVQMYGGIKAKDRALKETEYSEWKDRYDKAIATGDFDSGDNYFPGFDDWYENRTKAVLGGAPVSSSEMRQNEVDIDKLNLLMKLREMNYGK